MDFFSEKQFDCFFGKISFVETHGMFPRMFPCLFLMKEW